MKKSEKHFYHYTDKKGAKGIQESKKIYPSIDEKTDARGGPGVYLTAVKPDKSKSTKEKIMQNNYDGMRPLPEDRVSYYVRIPKSEVPDARDLGLKNRDVHVNPGAAPLDLSGKNYEIRETFVNYNVERHAAESFLKEPTKEGRKQIISKYFCSCWL